jgi:Uma2 family endonuclease
MSTEVDEPAVRAAETDMVTHLPLVPGGLDAFLNSVADRRRPLIKYRNGSLTLVSPSQKHERSAERLDDLVKAVCDGLGIDSLATASTLFRRPGMDHGIEADKTYYLAHEPDVRDLDEIDLSVYPPPDLVVEVVVGHPATDSLAVCQELGVPEVWVYRPRSRSLTFLHLDAQKARYEPSTSGRSFPFLTTEDVVPWVVGGPNEPDRLRRERLRAWVRDVLAPRRGAGA